MLKGQHLGFTLILRTETGVEGAESTVLTLGPNHELIL